MHDAAWPIGIDDVRAAAERIGPYCERTPCRRYPALDEAVGAGVRVWVKHENHQPTNAFKVRNAFSAMAALAPDARDRGVIGATRGNHGAGLAYAGMVLGCPVTICVPHGNNPEKNEAMRGYGAALIEDGADYDESLRVAARLQLERGLTTIHGTNNPDVLAGAGTIALEMLEQAPDLEAMVIAVGGGSQAVGALTVARARAPHVRVYAVQAAGAPAIYESWRAGKMMELSSARTFADGVATRAAYELTFPTLQAGLAGFVTVTDAEIAEAVRLLLRTTHNLAEGAGAVGLAGVVRLREELQGKSVGIILSGGNIDAVTLQQVVSGEI